MDLKNCDIEMLTEEIKRHLKIIEESILKIGEILLYIKENLLKRGEYTKWLQTVGIEPRKAQRMIQAYKRFGNTSVASQLSPGQLYEMLSLPAEVDCEEFIKMEHVIPKTGEVKKIEDMTTKEIRAVVKAKRDVSKPTDTIASSKESDISKVDMDSLIFELLNKVVFEKILLFSINDIIVLSKMSQEEQARAMDVITEHHEETGTTVTDLIKVVYYGMSNQNVALAVEASVIYHSLIEYHNDQKKLLNDELDNSIDLLRLGQLNNYQLTKILTRIRNKLKILKGNYVNGSN